MFIGPCIIVTVEELKTNLMSLAILFQHEHYSKPTTPGLLNTQRTGSGTTDVVVQQRSRGLLMMDILMSETCWEHKKWNKNSKWHQVGLSFFKRALDLIENFKVKPLQIKIMS